MKISRAAVLAFALLALSSIGLAQTSDSRVLWKFDTGG